MTDKDRPENRSKSTESGAPTARFPVRRAPLRSIERRAFLPGLVLLAEVEHVNLASFKKGEKLHKETKSRTSLCHQRSILVLYFLR